MDLRTFLQETESLLAELEPKMTPVRVRSIRMSLEHGEEGLGLNEFVATLIKNEVPVSPAQRDKLYDQLLRPRRGDSAQRPVRYELVGQLADRRRALIDAQSAPTRRPKVQRT